MRGRHAAPGSTELQEELTTPVEFGRFISNGTEKCGKVIRAANIGPK
jgi:hypothetical protein